MSESLLQLGGAPPTKAFKNVPLTTSVFFSGLWTQRSPFGSPDSRYYTKFLGGRSDILIDGSNTELTNYSTLIRRPGCTLFSTATLDSAPDNFYSFHPVGAPISVIADSQKKVYTLTPTAATAIFTKSAGAGQTFFQGVGSTLYMGNGVDQKAFPTGGTTRNWGLGTYAPGSGTAGPNTTGAGADGGGANVWSNPNNVTSAVSFASVTLAPHAVSNQLQATQFGFGVSSTSTIVGIQVSLTMDLVTSFIGLANVQLLKAGSPIGSVKGANFGSGSFTLTLGSSSDLWGATWTFNDINQTTFGAQISVTDVSGTFSEVYQVNNVQITVFTAGGLAVTVSGSAGSFSAVTGYQYIVAYANSAASNVGNPCSPSNNTGVFTNKLNVSIPLVASTDPQVTGIRVFRTKDGGTTFFELPTSPFSNTTGSVTDNNADATLQLLNFFPATTPWLANSPPPPGLVKMAYHLNRMWGVGGNNVYFSALLGDDIPTLGVGVECWPPANVFVFPNTVNRLLPIASGLLVFTTDDIYIVTGTSRTGLSGPLLTSQLFQQGVGLLSYNALDVEGNQVFLYTSDRQFVSFSASGVSEMGYAIGIDIQNTIDPSLAYVAALIGGTQDKAVFLSDGSSTWFRCNWNQVPEGGPAWSPRATIAGGAVSVVSVETSIGTHQLLIGQSNGTVLVRNYNVFTDNGSTYTAFATIGSLVLAKPGQLAGLQSIVLELQQVGSPPTLSIMLDEISGSNFETLLQSTSDPPKLSRSATIISQRWYLSQGASPSWCRHIQLKIAFAQEAFKNELLTVTAVGSLVGEE